MRSIYQMNYLGATGVGGGVMYIGEGVMAGADYGGGRYSGSFVQVGDRMNLEAVMSLPAGTTLVTGMTVNEATDVPLKASWSKNFANGEAQTILVAGYPVQVTFNKITDVP